MCDGLTHIADGADGTLETQTEGSPMDWLIAAQHWLYGGMADGLKEARGAGSLAPLIGSAFLFGIVHAFMPGHGKSVLVSYHLGRPGRIADGLVTGSLLALTHVGSAVVLVLAGVAVISRAFASGGRTPAFETASAALIAGIGLFLAARAIWPPRHAHAPTRAHDGRLLAMATGLVPCPLTTFILSFALARGALAWGLVAVAGMLAGVIVTIAGFAVAAIAARERFAALLDRTGNWRNAFGRALEIASALAVLGLGVVMLWGQLAVRGAT